MIFRGGGAFLQVCTTQTLTDENFNLPATATGMLLLGRQWFVANYELTKMVNRC